MAHATAAFDEKVRGIIKEWKVPGLAIAVIQNDEIDAKGYGVSHLDGEPCTQDTLFDCAIANEAYPDVQWHTPVSEILPEDFVLPDPYLTANATVEDVLSHRTGDPGHDDSFYGQKAVKPDDAKSITQNLRNLPFNKPLRTEYQYSNGMYTVATHLIESVTGESYSEFVRKNIWQPLDMLNTYHDIKNVETGNAEARLAMGHRWDKEYGKYITIPSYAQPEGQGAGCVYSSVSDYARWVRALLHRSGPLSEDAHKEMIRGRIIIPFESGDALPLYGHSVYALGLVVESYRGHVVIGHDGSFAGFKALMRYLPGQNWGVVMFGNSDDAFYVLQILLHQLVDEVLEIPHEECTDWPAYWRQYQLDEETEEETQELLPPESPKPLPVPLKSLAGTYSNAGYHELVLTHDKGVLEADCSDRGMPFMLRFDHFSGKDFVVKGEDLLDKSIRRIKAEFAIDGDGKVQGLGISLCRTIKDELIWFTRRS
ncbi:hypothetical protein N0V95_004109 [Ascochyta clinopodiicola]|nr:hypothetical protein N0V95_004109 [Ascochyta clinopodiicola]